MIEKLTQKFQELYGGQGDIRAYFAPGRVNLIGEHTDYNGGHVFPCALTLGTYVVARSREDRVLRFYSMNFDSLGVIKATLDDLVPDEKASWTNYPKGVMWAFEKRGFQLTHGLDIAIYGDIPNGSGLSSSASLEVVTGIMLKDVFGFEQLSMTDIALIGQDSENNYNGCNCGIMDQFAVGMGKQNQAILLDTNTLEYSYAPVDMGNNVIVIMNTNKRRELADSKYNERRSECETAVGELQAELDIKTLGELDAQTFDEYAYLIEDENRLKRARHAVWENQRTMQAQAALEEGDLEKFGRLVNASHVSLEHDYEVTGIELDTLAHTAWKQEGVLGARMTGAGFGGCGIAIVDKDKVEAFKENVGKVYTEMIGYAPAFYIAEIADGTKVL